MTNQGQQIRFDGPNVVQVPARLEPTGEKGWTVYGFANLAEAHAWAASNQDAAMPCWRRKECWGGKELGR